MIGHPLRAKLASRRALFLQALLAVSFLQGACAGPPAEEASAPVAEPWAELPPVPHPDLSSVEGLALQTLGNQRRALEALLADPGTAHRNLAEAFGRMAELYHSYDLLGAAEVAYGNALALAPESYRWAYLLGVCQARAGSTAAAAKSFETAAEHASGPDEEARALLRLGEVRLDLSAATAENAFSAALELPEEEAAPYRAAALYGRGRTLATEDPERAAGDLEEALELAPEAGAIRYPLAQAYRRLGEEVKAQEQLAAGGRGEVSFPDPLAEEVEALALGAGALMARGSEALVNGRLEEAESLYRKAVEADPESVEARRNLALALSRAGRLDDARQALEAALRTQPGEPLLLFDLANVELAQGAGERALDLFAQAIEAAPAFEAAHFNRANALMQLSRWSAAEGHLKRVLELSPGNPEARYLLAMAAYQKGRREEGLDELRQVVAEEPDLVAARRSLASILAQSGDRAGARRQYMEILERDPSAEGRAAAAIQLGQLARAAARRPEAESRFRQALELDPSSPEAAQALATVLAEQGRSEESLVLYEGLIQRRPQALELRLGRAGALAAAGRFGDARNALERDLQLFAGNVPLTHTLARLLATAPDPEARDGARALELAHEAYRGQKSLDHAETIAMAMAETGDLEGAANWQRGLLQQAQSMGRPELVARIRGNLALYEAGRPVRLQAGR